ncbi:LysR family transcriptional regulator [Streptomyces sp. HB2AG]|uniref:LysR family transcriptional regulator n=1 Tax=Streptomyces sp. HB2AG TaxID=2983400 RepID=UPI0022AB448A|nr:LysR family transcriptional regulator [Streptomyces sp. HB2AG]MCZ2525030.1 LysR family transcriptional regulator [Streptomyces sp. HB2AG]
MPHDIEPRLLRAFAAVAEELHFTRAAARTYVAQQALSRDVRRLEERVGAELFLRTTRRVELTAAGERLLPHALRVLRAHDELAAALAEVRGGPTAHRPLIVDVLGPGLTSGRVLDEARRAAPELDLVARFHSGLTGAAAEILAGRFDVSFGRVAGLTPSLLAQLEHRPVRHEPLAVILREDHRLAGRTAVPLDELAGETVYAGAGNPETPEWTDYARLLFEGRGIGIVPPAPLAVGVEEFVRVMRRYGNPVLASVDFPDMPGTVRLPITDPVPLSPVSMVWRRGLRHPGLDALHTAVDRLTADGRWLARPAGTWLPEPDARLLRARHAGGVDRPGPGRAPV